MKNEKSKAGRPPKEPDERLVQRSIRLSPAQWEAVDAAGGLEALRVIVDFIRYWPPVKPDKPKSDETTEN